MFEANIWGMMFYGKEIAGLHGPENSYGVHLYTFVGATLLFIRHADTMIRELGYSGPLHVQARIRALREHPWLYANYGGLAERETGSGLDDELEFPIPTTSEAMREKPDTVAMEILRYVFFSVNWPDLIDTQAKRKDLLRKAYRYNNWNPPEG
jgi:hypothetical protein